jgi:hypothetical protein
LADEAGSFPGFFPDIFAPVSRDAMTSCDDPIAIGYDRSSRVLVRAIKVCAGAWRHGWHRQSAHLFDSGKRVLGVWFGFSSRFY